MMTATMSYKKKLITFKDSLSLIPMKLESFPSVFKLSSGQKEMFPYKYYTFERLTNNKGIGVIEEAGNEELKWNQEQFIKI